jgi:AcrR family transcriptional regulator
MSTYPFGQDPDVETESERTLSRVRSERRRTLLDCAMRVFLREGYDGASMERVADEGSVSRQTLYNYFADKEELFIALVEERKIGNDFSRLEAAIQQVASAGTEAALLASVRLMLESCAKPEMAGLFRLLLEVSSGIPEVMERLRERVYLRGAGAVKAALDQGVAVGRLRPVDTQIAAHILFGVAAAYGVLSPTILGEHRPSIERMAAGIADLLTHGITATSGSTGTADRTSTTAKEGSA